MSGAFPFVLDPSQVALESDDVVLKSFSVSRKRQARMLGGHLWRLKIDMPEMLRHEFNVMNAFLMEQRGGFSTFTITLPGHEKPLGTWGTDIRYNSKTNDSQITLTGFTANDANAIKAGDLIKFSNDTKVYMVTQNTAANNLGVCSARIHPALIKDPEGNSQVLHTDVYFTVENESNRVGFTRSGNTYGLRFELVEAIV